MPHILSLNCGSSSLKAKLFSAPSPSEELEVIATASASNIGAKGKQVELKVQWAKGQADEKVQKKAQEDVQYSDLPGIILDMLTHDKGGVNKDEIKIVTHRIVHGSTHERPIIVTREHQEGLKEMDKLSSFAPLHNHNAVLAVRSCLDALPNHTSVLLFDTMFHQTLPEEVYTYAIPPTKENTPVPLRKYGFHGLSYASVLRSLASHLEVPEKEVDVVVCHLGSGGSVCLIEKGKSADTSMGLTPLEGIIGGTRSGSIDPTLIFHHTPECSANVDENGQGLITKAELVLNKSSGLVALAGTSDFGVITSRMEDPSSCSTEEHTSATLAYNVYLDRLLHYLSFYLFKLLARPSASSSPIHIAFSGGIGERSARLRGDVMQRLAWLGVKVDEEANAGNGKGEGVVERVDADRESKVKVWRVLTDEEEQCARMARAEMNC